MSDIKQIITFQNGLDSDTNKRFVKVGSSDYRLNCDVSIIGNRDVILKANGNALIDLDLPTGLNEVIGKCEDLKNNSIIYFIYNSESKHCIVKFNCSTRQLNKILWSESVLNFKLNKLVNAKVVDDDLYFVDGENENKKINIPKAINYTERNGNIIYSEIGKISDIELLCKCDSRSFSVGDVIYVNTNTTYDRYYSVISVLSTGVVVYCPFDNGNLNGSFVQINGECYLNLDDIALIRKKPMSMPIAYSYKDDTVLSSNIVGHIFKFCYRWIYKDNTRSVWSPFSFGVIPESQYIEKDDVTLSDNSIKIAVNSGNEEVKYIEIAFNADGDSNGWYIIDKYTRVVGSDFLVITFNYNLNYAAAILNEIEKSYDNIPISSVDLEVVPSTYLALSGNQMLSEKTELDCNISMITDDIHNKEVDKYYTGENYSISTFTSNVGIKNNSDSSYIVSRYIDIDFSNIYSLITTNLSNNITIEFGFNYNSVTFKYIKNILFTSTSYENYIKKFISSSFNEFGYLSGDRFYFFDSYNKDLYRNVKIIIYVNNPIHYSSDSKKPIVLKPSPSFRGIRKVGIVYYDNYGRNLGINTLDKMSVNFDADVSSFFSFIGIPQIHAYIEINSNPPIYASYYQVFSTKNQGISDIYSGACTGLIKDADGLYFKLIDVDSGYNILKYNYKKGDIIRIRHNITNKNNLNKTYIIKSISFSDSVKKIYIDSNSEEESTDSLFFEIISSTTDTDSLYYECSSVFPIKNGKHVGNIENQTYSSPAKILLTNGDIYHTIVDCNVIDVFKIGVPYASPITITEIRNMPKSHYSTSFSNKVDSRIYANGRLSVPVEQTQGGLLNNTLISNKYVPNTQQNGLSTFDWQNTSNELNEKYGRIYKSELVGDVFKVLQQDKLTSFYVGRDTAQSGDAETLIIIDAVLGKPRESNYNYGTIFPESVTKNDRNLYWYDVFKKCILRDSANGQEDISTKYGIASIIEEISNKILEDGTENIHDRYKVTSFVDSLTGMLYFTFLDRQNENSITLGFYEFTNQWISYYSFIPEMYSGINNMVSFKNGELWAHTPDSVKCNYYGVQYEQVLKVLLNEQPIVTKIANSFSLNTNKKWKVEAIVDKSQSYINGMYSVIMPNQLKLIEGKYFSEFLRNMKTRQSAPNKNQLYSGDKLRGDVIEMILTNNDTEEVWISNITINASVSNGTNV